MLFLLEENHQWQVQPPLDADHGAEMPSRSNIQLKEKQPITSISSVITYRLCPCDIKLMLYDEVTRGGHGAHKMLGAGLCSNPVTAKSVLGLSSPIPGPCTTEERGCSNMPLYRSHAGSPSWLPAEQEKDITWKLGGAGSRAVE